MKAIKISFCAFVALIFSTMAAYACSCIEYQNVQEHIDKQDVIFLGESTGTRTDASSFDRITLNRKTEFVIVDMLKGEKSEKLEVFHLKDTGGNCGLEFYKGARYLVFANKDEKGRLVTGFCSGTRQEVRPYKWSLKDYALTIRKE